MSALAILLIAVGVGDVCRRLVTRHWVAPLLAVVVVVACALLGGCGTFVISRPCSSLRRLPSPGWCHVSEPNAPESIRHYR